MWQCQYAKEPFDLKLYTLQCMKRIKWLFIGMILGALCVGGIYYLAKVTFGGTIPYVVTQKLYIEYAQDPDDTDSYSYFSGYTWNDWVKSDVFTGPVLEQLSAVMTKEELIATYEVTLPSDLRIPYLIVTHGDPELAKEIAYCLKTRLESFAMEQKELKSIEVIDMTGPELQVRDIRTFRAVVLGAVLGTFFALFAVAFRMILDEAVYLPETFTYRYQIPAVGYLDQEGQPSGAVEAGIQYLFRDKKNIGITAVEPEIDLTAGMPYFGDREAVCIPSVLQVPESLELLRKKDGNLLLVQAGCGNGKRIESVLHLCGIHDVPVTAVLLVNADRGLIEKYRFQRSKTRKTRMAERQED